MKKALLLLLLVVVLGDAFSQNLKPENSASRPKIGLVLSGGGAKGFAHIGVIKLLEEVGIVPDYITGTSMGSVVGALYAMGYTVDEMQQISDTTNWTMVLSNTVSLREVAVAEKPYYGTYVTELDVRKSGVSLPGGLIEGQNLLQKLSSLTQPVHGIRNFLDFPIPFTCVATDIVNGTPIALNHGDITNAIRASMAIPTAFTPVEYDSLLLIDGGWTRNLPVKEARDMGADIIIAVDVGAALKTKDELQSMISILDQTAWLLSVQDTEEQLAMSDYIIRPPVSGFSTFDFAHADLIINKGYKEAQKHKEIFEALAKRVYASGKNEAVVSKPNSVSTFNISNITVLGCHLTSTKFVKGRLNSLKRDSVKMETIEREMGLLFGSMYYKKVGFDLIPLSDSTQTLQVKVVEDNPTKLKLSFYYDTENSLGLNLNMTFRNVILRNSRLIVDGFVSENPIFGLKYLKYVGVDQKGFFYGNIQGARDRRFNGSNFEGQPSDFNYREFLGSFGVAYTIDNSWIFSLETGFVSAKAVPTSNPDTVLKELYQNYIPLRGNINLNTLNKAVFPTKGTRFHGSVSYGFNNNQTAKLQPDFQLLTEDEVNELIGVDSYFKFQVSIQKYIPVHPKVSLYVDGILDFKSSNDIGFNDYIHVGGITPILQTGNPFWGLKRNEVEVSQIASASFGFQWNVVSALYFKGKINYLNAKYPMEFFDLNKDERANPLEDASGSFELKGEILEDIWGFGGEVAYDSPVGPIRTMLHYSPQTNVTHFYLGIGYNIFKSRGGF